MTAPAGVVDDAIDVVCRRLAADLLAALRSYEDAKARFVDVTQAYERPDREPYISELRAADDPRRRRAAADCAWHQSDAMLAATALLALRTEQAAGRTR